MPGMILAVGVVTVTIIAAIRIVMVFCKARLILWDFGLLDVKR